MEEIVPSDRWFLSQVDSIDICAVLFLVLFRQALGQAVPPLQSPPPYAWASEYLSVGQDFSRSSKIFCGFFVIWGSFSGDQEGRTKK